ncbi:MAG TPA: FAD-dependent oxidoreductase [Pseudonocardiaceae bacterium]|nr:FAD-dependent oxidoreductase [Pseudonocardiaceae bacterium]
MTGRVVVVGYGMAGARLAEEIRRLDPAGDRVELTVVGAEPDHAYNRVLLSDVLAGSLPASSVRLHDDQWAEASHVDLRLDVRVTGIDRDSRTVGLSDGTSVAYDALVLATGARPWLPPVDGLTGDDGRPAPAVHTFRSLRDCTTIGARIRAGVPVAVLGGGLLGLEAARGVAARGGRVTVVHPGDTLMERQLDAAAGRVLARGLERCGVEFRLGVPAARYLPGDGLKLADGTMVAADLVIVSAGVRPDVTLASAAALTIDGGIRVDDCLRTNDPRIHAIGDCARHAGTVSGLVAPAWDQARTLASLLTGADPAARYRGTPVVTRLKARDIDLTAVGEGRAEGPDAEVVRVEDAARGRYAKLVVRDDRVAGAILVGLPDAAATITQLYDQAAPVPADRLAVLLGRALPADGGGASIGALPGDALICRCNSVAKARLVSAWRSGATDVPALAEATRAGTGCGGCRGALGDLVDWLAAAG